MCLLDGEGEAFSAEASLEWNVDQLTKAIWLADNPSESEAVLLTTSTCAYPLPSQLNDPIPVEPEETLPQ